MLPLGFCYSIIIKDIAINSCSYPLLVSLLFTGIEEEVMNGRKRHNRKDTGRL